MMHKDGSVPLAQLFGGWSPSRAVNPSQGDDPISLGMFSGALAPTPVGTEPAPPPPAMEDPLPPGPMIAPQPPMPDPRPARFENVVELDLGRVHLNGRTFLLDKITLRIVLEAILHDYEIFLLNEVDALKQSLLPEDVQDRPVQQADDEAAVVRQVPREAAPIQPAEQGAAGPTHLLKMPKAKRAARRVRSVPRQDTGEGATAPSP